MANRAPGLLLAVGLLATSELACGSGQALRPGSTTDAQDSADGPSFNGDGSMLPADARIAFDGRCPRGAFPHDDVCICQPDAPTICGDACTDLLIDPDNCGACGQGCAPTATCRVGKCGPPSTTIVPAATGCAGIDLAIAGTTLYWTDKGHGVVESMTLPAGAPKTIASGERGATNATLGGSRLFWIDVVSTTPVAGMSGFTATQTTAVLRAVALSGGTPVDLATETNLNGGIRGLAVSADGATVFYSADTKVRAVHAAGGVPIDVGSEERGGVPTALALAGNEIAFTVDIEGRVDLIEVVDGAVASCGNVDPTTGASLDVDCAWVARGQGSLLLGRVVLDGDFVYWADGQQVERDVATGPQSITTIGDSCIDATCDNVTAFAAGSDALYVAAGATGPSAVPGGSSGIVARVPYADMATYVALATSDGVPDALVLDASRVYWSTDACAIYSVAR